jgi:hypothetical protein
LSENLTVEVVLGVDGKILLKFILKTWNEGVDWIQLVHRPDL